MNKNNIIKFFTLFISISTIFFSAYYFGQKSGQKETLLNNNEVKNKSNTKVGLDVKKEDESLISDEPIDLNSDTIKKGWIKWHDPIDLGDIGLTSNKIYTSCYENSCGIEYFYSAGVKYAKSGEVIKGKYAGYDFLVVASGVSEGPSSLPNMFRLLKKSDNIIFLANPEYGLDEYMIDIVKKVFSKGVEKKEFKNIIIDELNYPEELYGRNDRERFEKDPYAEAFFVNTRLKQAFYNEKYGQVWMTDGEKVDKENKTIFELNSYINYQGVKSYYDIFNRYGFYIKSPDGTTITYKMKLDIFDQSSRVGILQATWNDGEKNKLEFEENPSGCGGGDYIYDETLKINPETDLMISGKTDKGDNILEYKDSSSVGFNKLYNEIYWTPEGEKKKTPEEFLKTHPKIFWKDNFGRILAFYNTNIISPAECGKPVIYLYPKKDQNVHVEVTPGKGLSITDPEYKNGWDVFAKTNGELINSRDGKKYPYLFWEGAGDVYYEMPNQGFLVEYKNLNKFFNDKLAKLGMIEKEISDFKEFWIPEMLKENKPYYFVTFLSKRFVDQNAPLSVSPKPDTVIRIMMDFKGLDKPEKFAELEIATPERKGFTVVEWGGMLK